jgi:hypothetical protein
VANELTVTGSLSGNKVAAMIDAVADSFVGLQFTMTSNYYSKGTILVATGGTAIPLGQVTTPHWAIFKNLDPTNFIRLANGSGGAKLPKMLAGEPALFPLDDTSTPYAFADTASCLMAFLIFGL